MNRLNSIWPFSTNPAVAAAANTNTQNGQNNNSNNMGQFNQHLMMNQFQQSQFLLLQQQLQHHFNSTQNPDLNLALHQQQLQQQQQQQQQQSQPQQRPNQKFSSSFSVNNLLGNQNFIQTQERQQQQQQQQLAAAVLTQHLAAAVASYRQNQFNKFQRPSSSSSFQESAFHQPIPLKRQRLNEPYEQTPHQEQNLNTSMCSISSPSSSSTASATSISLDYSSNANLNNCNNLNESDSIINNSSNQNDNGSERNSPDLLSSSSSTSSSSTSPSTSFLLKRSNRKRHLSIDLENLNCPICGICLSGLNDLKSHFDFELNKLNELNSSSSVNINNRKLDLSVANQIVDLKNSRYMKYAEIKENRQKRLLTKSNLRLRKNSKENLNYIETCKLNNKKSTNKREFDDIVNNSSDFTGSDLNNKRIKLINSGSSAADEISDIDEDDELINVVDNDDENEESSSYGKEQFNESDLFADDVDEGIDNEKTSNTSNSKCVNCLQSLKNALVSINCWHVNCKKCWSKSQVDKKTCPQCGTSTLPKDLRKIFL